MGILIFAAIIIRLLFSTLPSFEYDESAYRAWSQRLVELGPSQFYSQDYFTNNPLGGLYFFWGMGTIKDTFLPNLSFHSPDFDILLKLPANIADILSAFIIFLILKNKLGQKWGKIGFLMYVLNPAIFFNSSIWGQYDGLSTLFILIATYLMVIRKMPVLSTIVFAIAWTIKPQAIVFAPILLFLILTQTHFKKWLLSAFAFIITVLALYLPFFPKNPIEGVFYVNQNSANLFNCTTCFAFNFWGIFGNWQDDLQTIFNIPLIIWGVILSLISFIIIFFQKPFFKNLKPPYLYLTTATTIFIFFTFLTRMHERYLFPFFPFLLLAALMLRSKVLVIFYLFMSLLSFINLYIVYEYYNNMFITSPLVTKLLSNFSILSFISLAFLIFLIYFLKRVIKHEEV